MTEDEELPPGDAAESLRLIERERASFERAISFDPRLMYWPWGFAWLIGFGAFFLRFGPNHHTYVDMPDWVPTLILMGLILVAGAITGVVGARAGSQVSGPSSQRGFFYGMTWWIAFFGMAVVFSRLSGVLTPDQQSLLWSGGMVALTGALHMAGGAIWNNRALFVLGAWTSAVNIVGVLLGVGWNSLIVGVLAGGGMIVLGQLGWMKRR